jgi:4-hydroxy-4-methyl-2-oxoglutarate aldolase
MSAAAALAFLQQQSGISVCQIADAMGTSVEVDISLRPLDTSFRICAPAFTVQCEPDDNLTLHHALYLAHPGEALVVSVSGESRAALWGELMSVSAQARGLVGTIVDGAVRDPVEIAALGYPVFARTISPRRAGKDAYGSLNEAIRCGSLTVHAGDIVVGDANGILVFPPCQLEEVLRASLEVVRKELALKQQLSEGRTLFEIAQLAVPEEEPKS